MKCIKFCMVCVVPLLALVVAVPFLDLSSEEKAVVVIWLLLSYGYGVFTGVHLLKTYIARGGSMWRER